MRIDLRSRKDQGVQDMTTSEVLADKLTKLASKVTEGCIVELGSYHGKGARALAREAQVQVYSIDDYTEKRGWINEPYGPEDEDIFWETVGQLEVLQLKMTIDEAIEIWEEPIGLLYWDTGMTDRFAHDWELWRQHILPGGIFIAKDTPSDHLGTFSILDMAVKSRDWLQLDFLMGVTFLRRIR